jgi:hypothetical protein
MAGDDANSVNHALVRLLEQALAGAKAGAFRGGAVVLADKEREFHHFANAGEFRFYTPLIAGTAILLTDLEMTMRATQQHNANRLVRAADLPLPTKQ